MPCFRLKPLIAKFGPSVLRLTRVGMPNHHASLSAFRPGSPRSRIRVVSESWTRVGDNWTGRRCTSSPLPEETYDTVVKVSIVSGGVVLVRHAGVNNSSDLRWAMAKVFDAIADVRTPYLDSENEENINCKLVTAKALFDLQEKVEQLFNQGHWECAMNEFCKPQIVLRGRGTCVLRFEKDISYARMFWATVTMPTIPLSFLKNMLFWENAAVPAAQQAFRYTMLGGAFEGKSVILLTSPYHVQQQESMIASVARMGASVSGFVRAHGSV